MKPFEALTYLGQVRRLRRMAQAALNQYGLGGAKLTFINHGENATFRVDASDARPRQNSAYVENRYLLRLHRPGYQQRETIQSELTWLAALRRDTDLIVPEPIPSLEGELLIQAETPGVPQRAVSLLRWVRGRFRQKSLRLRHFQAIGRTMAHLQAHAAQWRPPVGFTRRHWDWQGLFGDEAGFNLSGEEVWALLPEPYYEPFWAVASQTRQVMDQLAKGPEVFGLIHADLLLGNLLFYGGETRPIDFDDCGFSWWVYDWAAALCHWQENQAWPQIRDALLDGYAQVRPLPAGQLAHLDLFMAARHVSEMLWAADLAQVNPSFRQGLGRWLEWAARHVKRYLER